MSALARLPVFLALEGKRAVLAGGSAAAAWKAELLAAAGAQVAVYATETSDELLQVVADPPRGVVRINRRGWTADDLKGAAVAIGAFENDADAREFAVAARAFGVPVNVIDKPAFCDFAFGAIVNRSPLVIGISTDGAAPVFAQAIRAKLEALLPKGFADWAAAAARWRAAVKALRPFIRGAAQVLAGIHRACGRQSRQRANSSATSTALLRTSEGLVATVENGSVDSGRAGPGDPELLTLRAVRALQSADVILFDDLGLARCARLCPPRSKEMLVGKTGFGPLLQTGGHQRADGKSSPDRASASFVSRAVTR